MAGARGESVLLGNDGWWGYGSDGVDGDALVAGGGLMDFRGLFDSMLVAVLVSGAVLGATITGLIWLAVYLWRHIDIAWIP